MTAEELTGQLVMVHPELYDDPAGKTGKIGTITAVDPAEDLVRVKFDDEQRGLYATNALLVFKPADQIYEHLRKDVMKLAPADFKDLKNIALLLDYGTKPQQRAAMEIAQRNPGVISSAFRSMEDNLGLNHHNDLGR